MQQQPADRHPSELHPVDGAERARVLLRGAQTEGRAALVELLLRPGAELPRHRHHWEDLQYYVLTGEFWLYLDEGWNQLQAGQAAWVSRGLEHSYAVVGSSTRVLIMFQPAGFEGFYDLPPALRGAIGAEHLIASAARFGCEITGPHPGRPP